MLGGGDGFLPLATAADVLGLSEDQTLDACRRSLFEWDEREDSFYVQPAIVHTTAVSQSRTS